MASSIIDNTISPACNLANESLIPISNYFTLRPASTRSTWKEAYAVDGDTNNIIQSLNNDELLTANAMVSLNVAYTHGLANKIFRTLEDKLICYEKTLTSTSCILRIMVPSSLR